MSETPAPDDDVGPPESSREVLDRLVANHRAFLAFLEPRVGSRALAEDLLQEAFAKSLDKVETLRAEESAVAWFYRLLRNAVIDHYRRNAASRRGLERLARELEHQETPAADLEGAICKCVAELATTLKPEYREALEAVELRGLAVKDYGSAAGLSRSNAGVRVFRAREALRKRVVRSCGSCAAHGCLDCTCGGAASGSAAR